MEKPEYEHCDLGLAAIVCLHVATRTHKILQAARDEPLEEADSGWQFLCNSGVEEDPAHAKIFLIREVLDLEPTLTEWIDSPIGTTLWRPTPDAPWQVWREGKRIH